MITKLQKYTVRHISTIRKVRMYDARCIGCSGILHEYSYIMVDEIIINREYRKLYFIFRVKREIFFIIPNAAE